MPEKYEFIEHTADLGFKVYGASLEALDELMVSWLDEFLYLYETEKLVFKRFQIKSIQQNQLRANAWGETMDPARHEIKSGIKAVTYHQLYVKEIEGRWEAQIILDI